MTIELIIFLSGSVKIMTMPLYLQMWDVTEPNNLSAVKKKGWKSIAKITKENWSGSLTVVIVGLCDILSLRMKLISYVTSLTRKHPLILASFGLLLMCTQSIFFWVSGFISNKADNVANLPLSHTLTRNNSPSSWKSSVEFYFPYINCVMQTKNIDFC